MCVCVCVFVLISPYEVAAGLIVEISDDWKEVCSGEIAVLHSISRKTQKAMMDQ